MKQRESESIPEDTRELGEKLLKSDNVLRMMGERLGELVKDSDFADLYSGEGKPAIWPSVLAMVTVLQWSEAVSDRQAAYQVVTRLDWKYALRLPLGYGGFDYSVLSEFRNRLLKHHAEARVFEKLLKVLKELGLVKVHGIQRTDGLAVLSAVSRLTRLELVYETIRVTLMAIKATDAVWFAQMIPARFVEQYGERGEQDRWVKETGAKGQAQVQRLAGQMGEDGQWLLKRMDAVGIPKIMSELPEVAVLRTVWSQQFEISTAAPEPNLDSLPATGGTVSASATPPAAPDASVVLREKVASPGMETICTPHDPQARFSSKRGHGWEGYKVHLTETADDDAPHIITDIQTTVAPASDFDQLASVQHVLKTRDVVPAQQIVDMGYVSGKNIAKSRDQGIELIGPARTGSSPQARMEGGLTVEQFQIDYEHRLARCPQGHVSAHWQHYEQVEQDNQPQILIEFDEAICKACPLFKLCVVRSGKGSGRLGRTLKLRPYHAELIEQRRKQRTPAFKALYKRRSGIEASLSMGVRKHGLRRTHYVGLPKTTLQHLFIATACNLKRATRWLAGHRPIPRTRRPKSMATSVI